MSVLQSSEGNSISIKSERPKVPIPRWGKSKTGQDISYHGKIERRRVTHACEPCREKKTKCDGGRPMCYHCRISGIACYYGDGKRERARKNLRTLENRIVDLEGLIQDIQPYLNNAGKLVVKEILAQNPVPSPPNNDSPGQVSTSSDTTSNYHFSRRDSTNSLSQSFMSTDIGSVSPVGRQVKDVHTEFVISRGERVESDSDPVWVCHGDEGLENDDNNAPASNLGLVPSYRTTGASAGCMGMRTSIQRNAQDLSIGHRETQSRSRQVDTFSLPPRLVAERLIDLYFTTVHPLFPIICKSHFMMQFNKYYCSLENSLEPIAYQNSRKWLTILNLVFAIAEKYLQPELSMNTSGQGRDADYFARSRILGALDGGSVFQIPDLGKIQALGLTGMYLLASIQTNRAWNVAGLAIRLAHGIGLHLRGDSVSGDLEAKMRVRIWYCLYCLETTLCLITGRPCAIQDRICSAPYPSALNDEILPAQYSDVAVLDAYFSKHQTLMAISADMLFILYSEKSFRDKSWSQVQDLIVRLSTSLQNWRIQLPLALDFFKEETDTVFRRQRLNLAFQYYTILMLTNRPCLSKTSARKDSTPNESLEFREFSKTSAETCINSARAIIHLIVKEYRSQDLIPNSPWWCLIHHLIPANKIIMLEMADENLHTPEYRAALLEDCKMVLVWLRSMSKVNAALRRHSLELSDQLKQVVPGIDAQLEEEIVESGTQDVTTQSISSSAEYTASTLPQATGFGDMRFDIYGKTCYTTEYQYFNSASALLCSSSYQPDRDSIMIESPSSGHSRPRNSPRVDNMSLWLDT